MCIPRRRVAQVATCEGTARADGSIQRDPVVNCTRMSVNGTAEAFTWDEAEGLRVILQDGSTRYITGPDRLPLEQVSSSGVLYYYQDQLGSTRGLLDQSGTTVATYTYDAYGTVTSQTGTVANPFQYAGQYTDAESGLQYLRARYYDPSTAQFLTVDPLSSVTEQPYSYGADDPVNSVDLAGLCTVGPLDLPIGPTNVSCSDAAGHEVSTGAGEVFNALAEPAYAPSSERNVAALRGKTQAERTGWLAEPAVQLAYSLSGCAEGELGLRGLGLVGERFDANQQIVINMAKEAKTWASAPGMPKPS